ncbi:hypothetical protein DFR70_111280 [Nocardia tenerifensis]|uniref:Uncharacterized protein n=1 Tax=Nocardia tenerifensis TaxID=228006 RepID=A0A318JXZ0_9NOCA|nr:hypothetical protein [Nocardia tenerifensis]PXX59893.1 hypothetical protein DFR70_111280 [Nocardia tenerifensis]
MRIVRFNSSWYWPRRDTRTAWCGVVIIVLVVAACFVAGYGEAVLVALATTVAGALTTEMIKLGLQARLRTA